MEGQLEVSMPTLVVGVGGMGKHVATHVKHILSRHYGQPTNKVGVLAIDTSDQWERRRARIPDIVDWERAEFELDYGEDSREFLHFGGAWGAVATGIAAQGVRGQAPPHQFISRWLKADDAQAYADLPDEVVEARKGVGRLRQASRACLFMQLGNERFVERLRTRVQAIARYAAEGGAMRIIVAGSIAGGTGCGTLWDVAMLIRHLAAGSMATLQVIGIVVLSRGFDSLQGVELSDLDLAQMGANCFAAFRELERLTFCVGHDRPLVTTYSSLADVRRVSLRGRLFDFVYLVDGSTLAVLAKGGVPHLDYDEGLAPAAADFVHLHLQGRLDEQLGLHTGGMAAGRDGGRRYPRDAGLYSSFGVHRLVFDVQGVIDTFAPQLAYEAVQQFADQTLPQPSGKQLEREVIDFLNRNTNTAYSNRVAENLQRPYSLAVHEAALLGALRPQDARHVATRIPDLVNDIATTRFGHSRRNGEIIAEAEAAVGAYFGSPRDQLGQRDAVGTLHAVMNYYLNLNQRLFLERLAKSIIDLANPVDNPASLLYVRGFLTELQSGLTDFGTQLAKLAQDAEGRRKGAVANVEARKASLSARNSAREQRRFLQARQEQAMHDRLAVLLHYMGVLTDDLQRAVAGLGDDVGGYIAAMNSVAQHMASVCANVKQVRRDLTEFRVRSYVTNPDDRWETRLLALLRGAEARGPVEAQLARLLRPVRMDELVGEFDWRVEEEDGNWSFKGYLSDNYIPIEASRRDAERWNYHFVRRMVELGHLSQLRKLSIFDLLAWKAAADLTDQQAISDACQREARALADRLLLVSKPMIAYDGQAQTSMSRYGVPPVAEQRIQAVLASWRHVVPGGLVSEPLRTVLGDRAEDYGESQHEIVARSTSHFLRMAAFRSLAELEELYSAHIQERRFPPVHVFLAERNAASYERELTNRRYIGLSRPTLVPQVVSLLEHEDELRVFARASVLGRFERVVDDSGPRIRAVVQDGGEEHLLDLPGGSELMPQVEAYCLPNRIDASLKSAFAEEVNQQWAQLQREAVKSAANSAQQIEPVARLAGAAQEHRQTAQRQFANNPVEFDIRILLSLMLDSEADLLRP